MDKRKAEAITLKNDITSLLAHPGWVWYSGLVEDELIKRRDIYELTPLETLDQTLAQEFSKGEMGSLRLVLAIPEIHLTAAKEFIEAMNSIDETEDEEEDDLDD